MIDHQHRMLDTETEKPQDVGQTLRRFWGYFGRYRLVLLLVGLFIAGGTYMQVLIPDLTGQAVDCYLGPYAARQFGADNSALAEIPGLASQTAQETDAFGNCWFTDPDPGASAAETAAGLGGLILLIVGLFVGNSILSGLQFYLMQFAGYRVLRDLRDEVFAHVHRLTLGYFTRHEAGDIMSRFTNDIDTIQQVITFALVNVAQGALLIVWIVVTMLSKNVPFSIVSLLPLPLMFLATRWFSAKAREAFRVAREEIGDVNADLQESISAVREVQAFSREEENIEQFRASNAANRDANIRAQLFTSGLAPTLEVFSYASLALVSVVGGVAILSGNGLLGSSISLGLIITFIGYTQQFNRPVQQISVLWTNIQNAIAGGERIFGLLDETPELADKPDAVPLPPVEGHVVYEDVWAEYNPGEPVLRGINIEAQPGQMIAIVGPTGAGKTTIINLLPRFWDVSAGRITIDGGLDQASRGSGQGSRGSGQGSRGLDQGSRGLDQRSRWDVRDVTRRSLREQIGMVLQDTFLFSDTVANNIRYGNPEASDDEVRQAAQLAQAHDFIMSLPDGYDTVLGERGGGLSQGQRQLLSIARVALSDPRILILDEATSSVDTRTERKIQAALDQLLEGRTSFVIAHRLSTIRNADQVLVLDEGQIIERGTHQELLAREGFYYELYMSQFRRSVTEEPDLEHFVAVQDATMDRDER
ncbi:MAG TPA: ABC transporter ATP-binding protein [Candidatus Sulfomarinibacteraceae bacterium]|nr:ABC transporter ATP-binding protein [Candidatus Sulfomarinibacteraceae bacterium]